MTRVARVLPLALLALTAACGGHRHGTSCHTTVHHYGNGHTRTIRTCHHY